MLYRVLKEWEGTAVGTVIKDESLEKLSTEEIQALIMDGTLQIETDPAADPAPMPSTSTGTGSGNAMGMDPNKNNGQVEASEEHRVNTEKTYMGLRVVSEGTRVINERTYKTVRLEDGSSYDLNDLDYDAHVKVTHSDNI